MKSWIWIFLAAFVLNSSAFAQDREGEEAVEIAGQRAQVIEDAKKVPQVQPVQEVTVRIPEIPQPLTDRELTPAEQARLDRLEHARANSTITETHYEGEKDNLVREANIKF